VFQFFSSQMQRLTSTLAHSSSVLTPLMVTLMVSFNGSASLAQTVSQPTETPASSETVAHFPDGVYFYGESPQPDRMGHGYMVFEARQQNLLGAVYLPHSSFDCFHGRVISDRLAMTVIHSYDRTTHPYEMALEPVAIASNAHPDSQELQFKPEGFYRIPELTQREHRILDTCRQDLQNH